MDARRVRKSRPCENVGRARDRRRNRQTGRLECNDRPGVPAAGFAEAAVSLPLPLRPPAQRLSEFNDHIAFHQDRPDAHRRCRRRFRRSRNSVPHRHHSAHDHDSAERDGSRVVANPAQRTGEQDIAFTLINTAAAIALSVVLGFWLGAALHALAAPAPRFRAAAVGLLRGSGVHLLSAADCRLWRRAHRAHRHGCDVRCGRYDREYDDRAGSRAVGHHANGVGHAAQPVAPAPARQAAGGVAISRHRRQACRRLFGDRHRRRRIHPGDGGHRQAHCVRLPGFRQPDHVRHAVAAADPGHDRQWRCCRIGRSGCTTALDGNEAAQCYDALLLAAGFLVCWQMLYWLVGPDVVSSPSTTISRAVVLLQHAEFLA